MEEEHRAVVTTPGVDLVTVVKYALAAHRRRIARDIVLLTILCALIVTFFAHLYVVFLLLLVAAWLTVLIERYNSSYGALLTGLQPGAFDPQKAPAPSRNTFAAAQLQRIAAVGAEGNVTLYSGFPPFIGYGLVRASWSFTVDVTRPRRSGTPKRFSVLEVYDHVNAGLRELDLPGIQVSERLFVNGQDIQEDRRFLPNESSAPVTSVSPELVRQLMATPEERARPYLAISMTGWQGDLVTTTFIRFLLSRTDLFVEAAHTVVPPLKTEFKSVDRRDITPTGRQFFALVVNSLIRTFPELLGSVAGIMHEILAVPRRERKGRRAHEDGDYGPTFSVREAAADSRWQRYFQIFDDERHVKVIEERIFRSLVEFLEDHDVDTSRLVSRTETVINNGVMVTDKATVNAQQMAAGAGAQATGLISRVRGTEKAANPAGGI